MSESTLGHFCVLASFYEGRSIGPLDHLCRFAKEKRTKKTGTIDVFQQMKPREGHERSGHIFKSILATL